MLVLEPLWRPDGSCTALLAHLPALRLPQLAIALAESPLAQRTCYWPAPDGELPPNLPFPNSLEAAQAEGGSAKAPARRIMPAQAPPPEAPAILTGFSDPTSLPALRNRDVLVCGPWITAPLPQSTSHPAQAALLELLGLIVRDAPTAELERIFAKAPQLTISLLRLVNSVAIGAPRHIESLHQAIALLGRRQLQRWLQLLLYAEQYGPEGQLPPIFTAAALRAKRLELWASAGWLNELTPEAAFLCGMLSLIDRLFGKPLAELLAPLPLPHKMLDALLHGQGETGMALACLALCETGDAATLGRLLGKQVEHPGSWMGREVNALAWALSLHGSLSHAP